MTSSANKTNLRVSICVVAYNQEKYIEKCLSSILEQEVDFEFEIIVADDCSTDNTLSIIRKVATQNAGVIKIISQKENVGPVLNYLSAYSLAGAEYVAHCDGDDYWLPTKLSKQIEILDSDSSICAAFTNGICNEKLINSVEDVAYVDINAPLGRIFTSSRFIHSSFVVRGYQFDKVSKHVSRYGEIFDFEVYWHLLRGGKTVVLGEPLVVYSINPNGISKDSDILLRYANAVDRLRDLGMADASVKRMSANHKVSRSLIEGRKSISFFEFVSTGNFDFGIFFRIFFPGLWRVLKGKK